MHSDNLQPPPLTPPLRYIFFLAYIDTAEGFKTEKDAIQGILTSIGCNFFLFLLPSTRTAIFSSQGPFVPYSIFYNIYPCHYYQAKSDQLVQPWRISNIIGILYILGCYVCIIPEPKGLFYRIFCRIFIFKLETKKLNMTDIRT